jgi:hypothetical protein
MKKVLKYASLLLMGAAVTLSSCKKTTDPAPADVTPDVTLTMNQTNSTGTANTNYTVTTDKGTAIMQVTALTATNNDMSRLYVYVSQDNGPKTNVSFPGFSNDGTNAYYNIANASRNNFTIDLTASISTSASRVTDKYFFYFTSGSSFDVSNPGSNVKIGPGTITLVYDVKLASVATAQKIYSICSGPNNYSAYNLVALSGVSTSVNSTSSAITVGSGADMAQQSGSASCGSFDGWVGQGGTTFVKANSLDFSVITRNQIATAFSTGTSTANVTGVSLGDVYVANLKGSANTYAVFKITGITTNASNNNFYQFDVKK